MSSGVEQLNNTDSTSVLPLNRLSVVDRDRGDVDWSRVACAVFACGTEARCVTLLTQLPDSLDKRTVVLEFEGQISDDVHMTNRRVFLERVNPDQFFIPGE